MCLACLFCDLLFMHLARRLGIAIDGYCSLHKKYPALLARNRAIYLCDLTFVNMLDDNAGGIVQARHMLAGFLPHDSQWR